MSIPLTSASTSTSTGRLGLELRFLWGDTIVGEHFLPPGRSRTMTVGSSSGCDFSMGTTRFAGRSFELAQVGRTGASVRFTSRMKGEVRRAFGDEVLTLEQARTRGVAQPDDEAFEIPLRRGDSVRIDLGGVAVEGFLQPAPKPVVVPLAETVDFTTLNLGLVLLFLGALFAISAIEGVEVRTAADEHNTTRARLTKLLMKSPVSSPNSVADRLASKNTPAAVEPRVVAERATGAKRPARPVGRAPAGGLSQEGQVRRLMNQVFGGAGPLAAVFSEQPGLGGELNRALGQVLGATEGPVPGFGGLGLRGGPAGGGEASERIGIGGLPTRGRAGGSRWYGEAVVPSRKTSAVLDFISTEPTVAGSLDKDLIRLVIHAHRGQIRYCYEEKLARFPTLEGKVAVNFVISPSGTVIRAQLAQSTMTASNSQIEACVLSRVKMWQFPKPRGGGVVIVTYPFLFRQSGPNGGLEGS